MRILFVENRYATWLYQKVAEHLEAGGHEIHWLIQNPLFAVSGGRNHVIPFPLKSSRRRPAKDDSLSRIAGCDRQVLYYGYSSEHYGHYYCWIEKILRQVAPHLVFGESTQFYELITIECSRQMSIKYLNAVTVGCPPGRVYFLMYDTKDPFGGSRESLDASTVIARIDEVNTKQVTLRYMQRVPLTVADRFIRRTMDLLRISRGWLIGERYATPSPLRKISRGMRQSKIRRKWERIAENHAKPSGPFVLYAMHVQPECSIDVWGGRWRDQTEIIRLAGESLAVLGIRLAVKPHPNAKYEITEELCELAEASSSIVPLSGNTRMSSVFAPALAVLGVTGTVLLEAVFAGKLAISVGPNAMSRYPGILEIDAPDRIADVLKRYGSLTSGKTSDAVALMRWIYEVSYPGEMFEPLFADAQTWRKEMKSLGAAFDDVVTQAAIIAAPTR